MSEDLDRRLNALVSTQLAEFARLPTIHELARQIRELPPYEGPSSAEIVRSDRDQR